MTSAAKAKVVRLFMNDHKAVPIQQALHNMGQQPPLTILTADNSSTVAMRKIG